jgi:hypothetical protein
MTKSRRMILAGYVSLLQDIRNSYMLVRKPETYA